MLQRLASFSLIIFFLNSCVPDVPDTLGDLLVRFDPPITVFPDATYNVGVFPSETILTEEYTADMAIKSASINEDQAVITDVLPGIYVVAIFNLSSNPPRQVIQIVADEVTVVDFDLNALNDD
jgi:hypothetical protein